MAKLARKTAVLFAANKFASPAGFIAVYGSKALGSPAFSSDPDTIQSLSSWQNGWTAAVVGTNQPNLEDVQAFDVVASYFINNIAERGVLDYDVNGGGTASDTTYYLGAVVNDGSGNLYVSKVDNNTALLSDTNSWITLADFLKGQNIARAWLQYDGVNDVILGQSNVDHVTKIAAGVYDVYFVTAMPSNRYTFTGSCGTQDGAAVAPGDNNVVCGGVTGFGDVGIRTTTRCRIYCWEPNNGGMGQTEDTGCLSVQFFGN